MSKTWFYHYTGGYCGTDEYGLVQAETEDEACEIMYPDACAHAEQWAYDPRGGNLENDEGDGFEVELETDLYVQPYDPDKHNCHLNFDDPLYLPDKYDRQDEEIKA